MQATLSRRLFTVDDYYRMAEEGILFEDDNVELIEGVVVDKHPSLERRCAYDDVMIPWRFTADDFHAMVGAGVLHEDERLELIDGEIIEMSPIGVRHAEIVDNLDYLLKFAAGDSARVRVQNAVRLGGTSEPVPDISVVQRRRYEGSLPGPNDSFFFVEVSDTTLSYDLEVKLPLYAAAGIREVWIVDVSRERISRFFNYRFDGYRTEVRFGRGQQIETDAVPGIVITLRIDDVFE